MVTMKAIRAGESESGMSLEQALALLWTENPDLKESLRDGSLEQARKAVLDLVADMEKEFVLEEKGPQLDIERSLAEDAQRILRRMFSRRYEKMVSFSAIDVLRCAAKGDVIEVSPWFVTELVHLFRAARCRTGMHKDRAFPSFVGRKGRDAALVRSNILDEMTDQMDSAISKYPSGLDPEVRKRRLENKARILDYFKADENDWLSPAWQLKHVVKTPEVLKDLVELDEVTYRAVARAVENKIPFGITPYYISLFEERARTGLDRAVRAQVLPPQDYVEEMSRHSVDKSDALDFMGENDTSPTDLVTRRYPKIAILKPYMTCAQICVYCQRDWEIKECMTSKAMASRDALDRAIEWFRAHPKVGDILVTGGDPCVMKRKGLEPILDRVASLQHVYRIRIGTRTPVVLPMRWSDEYADFIASYREPGRREVAVMTHFEHSYEITPEAMQAVQRLKMRGVGVYNQEVFTFWNSRRFESVKLRMDLRRIGVDPYYNFNTKGKEETRDYRVPIARILQERKEEAALLPGLDRTDEPVFNVPRLGKSHLRSWQDHRIVAVMPDGSRVYEFHPWEKNLEPLPTYLYKDVPIGAYLDRLAWSGENPSDYSSIWYYY